MARGAHQLVENGAGLGGGEAFADPQPEQAVQRAGHQGELDVEVDPQRHGGREGVHVEEVDRIGDGVLDHHAAGIAVDQGGDRAVHLVGQQQGGLLVAEVGDGDLADRLGVAAEPDRAVEDARGTVDAADIGKRHLAPLGGRGGQQLVDQLGAAAAQGEEVDAELVEPGEVGVGGQAGVEDEFGRVLAGAVLPGFGEAQDGGVLVGLAQAGIGPGEQARVGVAGEEGEDAFLAAAALGDVVALDERVVPVEGNGVEVEVEGLAEAERGLEGADGVVEGIHQGGAVARISAAGVFGQGGALGDGVEAGEEGEALIEGLGHDAGGAADTPQLEGEQGADGAAGREHGAGGQVVAREQGVEAEAGQVGSEQEEAPEVGAEAAGSEVEEATVGDGRGGGEGALGELVSGAAPELGHPVPVEHAGDSGSADGELFVGAEVLGDFGGGEVAFRAQGEDALVAVGAGRRLATAARVGQEEGLVGVLEEGGAEVAQGARGVAEAAGGLGEGGALDEEAAQGFVAAVGGIGGDEEVLSGVLHV